MRLQNLLRGDVGMIKPPIRRSGFGPAPTGGRNTGLGFRPQLGEDPPRAAIQALIASINRF